jgi:hypothetical protein
MNYQPDVPPKPLDFGTSVHRGLEVYYTPVLWKADRKAAAILGMQAFEDITKAQQQTYVIHRGDMAVEIEIDMKERLELGRDMLSYYFNWAEQNDFGTNCV